MFGADVVVAFIPSLVLGVARAVRRSPSSGFLTATRGISPYTTAEGPICTPLSKRQAQHPEGRAGGDPPRRQEAVSIDCYPGDRPKVGPQSVSRHAFQHENENQEIRQGECPIDLRFPFSKGNRLGPCPRHRIIVFDLIAPLHNHLRSLADLLTVIVRPDQRRRSPGARSPWNSADGSMLCYRRRR